jgi:hypothetical protein
MPGVIVLAGCRQQASALLCSSSTKVITLPKLDKDSKLPQNLCPTSLLPTTGKLLEKKIILKIAQKHIEESGLLNATPFGFRTRHSTSLQCMRLTDQRHSLEAKTKMNLKQICVNI